MQIITLGQRGYLGKGSGQPTCVLSQVDARPFETKKQANRVLERFKTKFPSFNFDDAKVTPAEKALCAA